MALALGVGSGHLRSWEVAGLTEGSPVSYFISLYIEVAAQEKSKTTGLEHL